MLRVVSLRRHRAKSGLWRYKAASRFKLEEFFLSFFFFLSHSFTVNGRVQRIAPEKLLLQKRFLALLGVKTRALHRFRQRSMRHC